MSVLKKNLKENRIHLWPCIVKWESIENLVSSILAQTDTRSSQYAHIWKHLHYQLLQWAPSVEVLSKTCLVITSSLRFGRPWLCDVLFKRWKCFKEEETCESVWEKGLLWIHHNHLVKTGEEKHSSRQRTVKTADEATEINHPGGSMMNTYR